MVIVPLASGVVTHLKQSLHCQGIDTVDYREIPVNLIKDGYPVKYGSAIALKLARFLNQSPLDIADSIVGSLDNLDPTPNSSHGMGCQDFIVKIIPPGLLEFTLGDQGVGTWLDHISQNPFPLPLLEKGCELTPKLFPVQYSHARCCSLLRLAHRDKIIQLEDAELTLGSPFPQFRTPEQIPWLTTQEKLQLIHPSEYQLLTQLIEIVDHLEISFPIQRWEKLVIQLSDKFQEFYRDCRIWGEVKRDTPQLAQARLGLVWITRSLLHFLLQEKLAVQAPIEL